MRLPARIVSFELVFIADPFAARVEKNSEGAFATRELATIRYERQFR
jgi:hypothetical protein